MTIADTVTAEKLKLTPDTLIELFELDLSPIGVSIVEYFYCGTDTLRDPIVFNGITYEPWPITGSGFALNGQGSLPTPTFTIWNGGGVVSQTVMQYADLVGAQVTRTRTHHKFLDGMPLANPAQVYPIDIYRIGRKTGEDDDVVSFSLVCNFDLNGATLPSRQVIQNSCPWIYKSAECSWVPIAGFYFDSNDAPTSGPTTDVCSQQLSGCECRFASQGANPRLPFGGFPGAQKYV